MTRKPLPYLVAIMAAYASVVAISPDMFGAPPIVKGIAMAAMVVVVVASGVLLIKELME